MLSTGMTNDKYIPPSSESKANLASEDEGKREILNFLKNTRGSWRTAEGGRKTTKHKPTTHRKANIIKYCYSRGFCAHDGNGCKPQFIKCGHKVEATFEDKMGGLTAYYRNVNSD